MKQLLLSTSFLFFVVWSFGQSTSQYVQHQGFIPLDNSQKAIASSAIKNHLKLSDRHELLAITDGGKRLQHYYAGYEVVNSIVVTNPYGFGGSVYQFEDIAIDFDLHESEVSEIITSLLKLESDTDMSVRAVLYPSHSSIHPAYEISITHATDLSHSETVYISASSGDILYREPLTIPHNTPVIGRSLYDGLIFTDVYREGDTYNMSHPNLDYKTYDLDGATHTIFGQEIQGDQGIFQTDHDAVQAHYALGSTLDYYALRHGRESYDNEGSPVSAYINYGNQSSSAFWSQGNLLLGGGDGVHYDDMAAVDIVGHEFTHGVIQHTADLRYAGESGALNESFADIFGEMSEFFSRGKCDWRAGQQVGLSSRVRFRSFRDPNSVNHPDTYRGELWVNPECGTPVGINDFCGVHTNSSVQNKWFYILANGETGVNDNEDHYHVTGITPNAAAAIAYKNLTEYLWPTSTFEDARQGAILAAREIYGEGSMQEVSTTNAWYAVGVGQPYVELPQPEEQIDSISHLAVTVIDITTQSAALSWSRVDSLMDTLWYQVVLDGDVVLSTSDTSALIAGLLPSSLYSLLVKGYRDSVLVGLSDTIGLHTVADESLTGELAAFFFEEGLDDWSVSSDDAELYFGSFSPEGNGSIRLRDDYDNNMILSPWIKVPIGSPIDGSLSLYAWSVEFGEDVTIEYRGRDSMWHTIQTYRSMFDFRNDQATPLSFSFENINHSDIQFRVFLDATANTDHVYFDEFVITSGRFNPSFNPVVNTAELWPNPVTDLLNVNIGPQPSTVQVYDLSGKLVFKSIPHEGLLGIDLSHLQSGLYLLEISTENQHDSYPIVKN